MWMRSCAICEALMKKLQLCDSVRLPCMAVPSVAQSTWELRLHGLDGGFVYLNPTEPFNLYLEVGFVAGLFAASPLVFYQLWLFIAPGLYRNEKCYVFPFLISTVGLFLAGGFLGYRKVYPASLDLIGYGQRF
jgi:sec-independent protein translocase protein TatC